MSPMVESEQRKSAYHYLPKECHVTTGIVSYLRSTVVCAYLTAYIIRKEVNRCVKEVSRPSARSGVLTNLDFAPGAAGMMGE